MSPVFQKLFDRVAELMPEVLERDEIPFVKDVGAITFGVTYADYSKEKREFYLEGDEFRNVFSLVKQMVPGCESVPEVIKTSEDFRQQEE